MPKEIDVEADGDLRVIRLNRPDALNAVNDDLHVGLASLWPQLNEDSTARAGLTGFDADLLPETPALNFGRRRSNDTPR